MQTLRGHFAVAPSTLRIVVATFRVTSLDLANTACELVWLVETLVPSGGPNRDVTAKILYDVTAMQI